MRKTLTRAILGGVAVLALTAPAVAQAATVHSGSITPDTTFKIQNTGPGGCWKDQGLGATYTVSACPTASNFHVIATVFYDGDTYSQWKDGSGNCATVSARIVKAGTCASTPDTQMFDFAGTAIFSQYDTEQGDGFFLAKGSISPFYVNDNSSGSGPAGEWKES